MNSPTTFPKAIVPECSTATPIAFDTSPVDNRYSGDIFHGHAIGCQRCHGPGELHVKRRKGADAGRTTTLSSIRAKLSRS